MPAFFRSFPQADAILFGTLLILLAILIIARAFQSAGIEIDNDTDEQR